MLSLGGTGGISKSLKRILTLRDMVRHLPCYPWICPYALLCYAALAIDMTARNMQDAVKKKGLPWTAAKGFDTFTPVG